MKKYYRIYFILVFGLFVIGGILLFCTPQHSFSPDENAYLTKFPKISVKAVIKGTFQKDITEAANDQFYKRNYWISQATFYKKAMGEKDINNVYLGKDGYYFQKFHDSDIDTDQYEKNLKFVSLFEMRNKNTRFVLVPSPETILKDKLPRWATEYDAGKLYRQAEKLTDRNSFTDLRETLEKTAAKEQTYYRTDHHWTLYGAYSGYRKIAEDFGTDKNVLESMDGKKVTSGFYGTLYSKVLDRGARPDDIYIYNNVPSGITVKCDGRTTDSVYNMKKLETKDKYAVFFNGNYDRITVKNPGSRTGKKLLVIKDSFANSMLPYLVRQYRRIDIIDLRYFRGSLKSITSRLKFDDKLILYEMTNFASDINLYKLAF